MIFFKYYFIIIIFDNITYAMHDQDTVLNLNQDNVDVNNEIENQQNKETKNTTIIKKNVCDASIKSSNIITVMIQTIIIRCRSATITTENIDDILQENKCPICWEDFDKRYMSFTLRKPIALHDSHAVKKHEFCERCLITLMGKTPIKCPTCRYELQIQDEKQLQKNLYLVCKKYLKETSQNIWNSLNLACLGQFLRHSMHLINIITPVFQPWAYLICFYTGIPTGLLIGIHITDTIKEQTLSILLFVLASINLFLTTFEGFFQNSPLYDLKKNDLEVWFLLHALIISFGIYFGIAMRITDWE